MDHNLIICIWIPRFALEVNTRSHPPKTKPDAIYRAEARGQPLLVAREDLEDDGLHPGLPLHEVQARWSTLQLQAYEHEQVATAFEPILDILYTFSPFIESTTVGHAYLDASRLQKQYGSPIQLAKLVRKAVEVSSTCTTQVGVGSNKFVADVAARAATTTGIWAIPLGQELQTMSQLSLETLRLPPDVITHLHTLGIRTAGAFANLPASSIYRRFGPTGLRAYQGLHQRLHEPLQIQGRPLVIQEQLDLDWTETNPDRLQFACAMLTDRLSAQLHRHGMACQALMVFWCFEDHSKCKYTLYLAEPAAQSETLLQHLRWHLDQLQIEQGIIGIHLQADQLSPAISKQLKLLTGSEARTPDIERRRRALTALGRLQARWSTEVACQTELTSEHDPEQSFRWLNVTLPELESNQAPASSYLHPPFLFHNPPEPIRLLHVHDGRHLMLLDGQSHVIHRQAGPWRLHQPTWRRNATARDYYQIEAENGAAFLCFYDQKSNCWYLQGRYA
jgi:protein ImuB